MVALRLECVDRNIIIPSVYGILVESHSVWSAWIEINTTGTGSKIRLSHSVWSAWIEMTTFASLVGSVIVALRLECVDRNADKIIRL